MGFLGRDAILGATDFEYTEVDVPEWGGVVRVRPLTARERSQIEGQMTQIAQSKKGYDKLGETALKMVVWCVVDENGDRVLEEKDVVALGKKSAAPILRIRNAVMKVSQMGAEDVEEAEEDFTDSQDSLFNTD